MQYFRFVVVVETKALLLPIQHPAEGNYRVSVGTVPALPALGLPTENTTLQAGADSKRNAAPVAFAYMTVGATTKPKGRGLRAEPLVRPNERLERIEEFFLISTVVGD